MVLDAVEVVIDDVDSLRLILRNEHLAQDGCCSASHEIRVASAETEACSGHDLREVVSQHDERVELHKAPHRPGSHVACRQRGVCAHPPQQLLQRALDDRLGCVFLEAFDETAECLRGSCSELPPGLTEAALHVVHHKWSELVADDLCDGAEEDSSSSRDVPVVHRGVFGALRELLQEQRDKLRIRSLDDAVGELRCEEVLLLLLRKIDPRRGRAE